jgi:RNA polymerase sigma-70 factor (ECF subfamily)
MHTTPITLLDRLREGPDDAAWDRFVELYTPILLGWARRQGESPEDAADLVQEVFIALVESLSSFRRQGSGGFRRWLKTILLNKARDCRRRRARTAKALAQRPAREDLPDNADLFEEADFRQELARRALRLMQAEFTPTTWKACWETLVRGRPIDEVAGELDISENAVYLARCRVLRRLRQELGGLLD